ncbi:N-acetylmuramoyl-L-alanine amidase family protein, partial [Streptococcus agalactiae]|uniref:N-acetylmuramoyl-L-alanine amidase family protein n=1 Tax=Streptococcus agalactiae TaxID=1311 RepID=UPI00178C2359
AMALELKHAFASDPRYSIVLTRTKDEFVPLSKRVQIAQEAKADIFISLHADSVANRKANGISVYALSEGRATSEQAKLL